MCCIELMGEEQNLLMGLAHLTSPETGKLFLTLHACWVIFHFLLSADFFLNLLFSKKSFRIIIIVPNG